MRPLLYCIPGLVLGFSLLLTGCGESFPKTYEPELEQSIAMTPREVISQMSLWSAARDWDNPPLDFGHASANHFDNFEKTRLYYQYGEDDVMFDTILVVDPDGDPIPGDPYDLEERHIPELKLQYIGPEGYFQWRPVQAADTACNDLTFLLRLQENATTTTLTLVRAHIGVRCGRSTDFGRLSVDAYLEKLFQKEVIDPLSLPLHAPK